MGPSLSILVLEQSEADAGAKAGAGWDLKTLAERYLLAGHDDDVGVGRQTETGRGVDGAGRAEGDRVSPQ